METGRRGHCSSGAQVQTYEGGVGALRRVCTMCVGGVLPSAGQATVRGMTGRQAQQGCEAGKGLFS